MMIVILMMMIIIIKDDKEVLLQRYLHPAAHIFWDFVWDIIEQKYDIQIDASDR